MSVRHALVAVAALMAVPAMASTITLSDGDASPTQVTIPPGQTFSLNVIIDNDVPTAGLTYYLSSNTSGLFSIVGRTVAGTNPYTDSTSSDAVLLAAASALLDPQNNSDLGGTNDGSANAPAGTYVLGTLSLSASLATPEGSYTIFTTTASVNNIVADEFSIANSAAYIVNVAVPEPASLGIIGLAGLLMGRRRVA